MRRFLLVAAVCMIAAPCLVSAGVPAIDAAKGLKAGSYDMATGQVQAAESLRGDPPMWAAEVNDLMHPGWTFFATHYAWTGPLVPGHLIGIDWGDLSDAGNAERSVGSFNFAYSTNHTHDFSGETGLDMVIAFYADYDGQFRVADFPAGYYEPDWAAGFSISNLGGIVPGDTWALWVIGLGDLTNALPDDPNGPFDWSFSLDGADIDSDGNADFGYGFYVIESMDATGTGWIIGDAYPGDVGSTNDWLDYELSLDPNLDPNDPNALDWVISGWWFWGFDPNDPNDVDPNVWDWSTTYNPSYDPYAQMFMRLWGISDAGCPAECSTSLDDDCDVDFDDLNILLSVYGGNPGHPADFGPPAGVDFDDLNLLLSQYNNNCDAP